MQPRPSDSEVDRVMAETGMDRMQAYRHVEQRMRLRDQLQRNPQAFPLGKSSYD